MVYQPILKHKCLTRATRGKNFDFDNDTNENIFSHPYISYISNETLQGEEQFHSKNYLLEMTRSRAKMHLKSAPQNLNFVMAKAISKSYTLDMAVGNLFYHAYHFGRQKQIIPTKSIFMPTKHKGPNSCPELFIEKHPSYPLPSVRG